MERNFNNKCSNTPQWYFLWSCWNKILVKWSFFWNILFLTSLVFEMNFFSKRTVKFFHREETIGKGQEHIWDWAKMTLVKIGGDRCSPTSSNTSPDAGLLAQASQGPLRPTNPLTCVSLDMFNAFPKEYVFGFMIFENTEIPIWSLSFDEYFSLSLPRPWASASFFWPLIIGLLYADVRIRSRG